MFYKLFYCFLFVTVLTPSVVTAQTATTTPATVEAPPQIVVEDFIRVGKKALFDVALPPEATSSVQFSWDFGDRSARQEGEQVVHQFNRTGQYTISLRGIVSNTTTVISASRDIFVYDKKVFLVTDQRKSEELSLINDQARDSGVALKTVTLAESEGGFLSENELAQAFKENNDYIRDADALLFYTKSSFGLQAFARYVRDLPAADKEFLRNKFYVEMTDSSFEVVSPITAQSFKIISPSFILLTRPEALSTILSTKDYTKLINTLQERGIDFRIIDERGEKSHWFVLSHVITSFVTQGVSSNTIYLILIIPFLVLFTVFCRQVIGIETFGVYSPVMTAASFYILGIRFGLLTFLFVVISSYLVKFLVNKFELLYVPKMGLNLAFLSLSFLFIVWLFLELGSPVSLSLAIFPMLLMSTIAEKFTAAQAEEGFKSAVLGTVSTLIVVIVSYYIIKWTPFQNLLASWPELLIIPLVLTFILGKFSGLRLSEYLRFRSLFKEHTEEE
ncbi:MAG TPA: 7TM domain-containing protein [Patescibacteria group bacterium]|nr:7TM domain-containing protein [Patescibacteria group bacterium]